MGSLPRAFRHCAAEAWEGLSRNPGLSLLAVVSIGVSLFILGLFVLLILNLNHFVDSLGHEAQVQIYLRDGAGAADVDALRAQLRTDPAIESTLYVSSEEARRRFHETFPSLRDLAERVGGNPFPAAFELRLREGYRDRDAINRMVKSYDKAPGVEEVRYDLGWVERLTGIAALVRRGGYGIGAILALAVMITVGAVVRLTVLARREEIEIMKLVGATAAYIRAPFLVGAAVQGLAGGALASGLLLLTHRLIGRSAIYQANPFMSIVLGRFLPAEAVALLVAGGAALGLVGATLSLRRAGTF